MRSLISSGRRVRLPTRELQSWSAVASTSALKMGPAGWPPCFSFEFSSLGRDSKAASASLRADTLRLFLALGGGRDVPRPLVPRFLDAVLPFFGAPVAAALFLAEVCDLDFRGRVGFGGDLGIGECRRLRSGVDDLVDRGSRLGGENWPDCDILPGPQVHDGEGHITEGRWTS